MLLFFSHRCFHLLRLERAKLRHQWIWVLKKKLWTSKELMSDIVTFWSFRWKPRRICIVWATRGQLYHMRLCVCVQKGRSSKQSAHLNAISTLVRNWLNSKKKNTEKLQFSMIGFLKRCNGRRRFYAQRQLRRWQLANGSRMQVVFPFLCFLL